MSLSYSFRPCNRTMILRGNSVCGASIVPWHPVRRAHGEFHRMAEQLRHVVERIDFIQFAGMDQAHEEIAHPRPVRRLIEEGILPVKNRLLQCPLNDIMPRAG